MLMMKSNHILCPASDLDIFPSNSDRNNIESLNASVQSLGRFHDLFLPYFFDKCITTCDELGKNTAARLRHQEVPEKAVDNEHENHNDLNMKHHEASLPISIVEAGGFQ